MRANSPSSLLLSFTLHALFVAAILGTTYVFTQRLKEQPVIFELVAGDATAPDELVAPALGNTTKKITLEVPKVELVPTMPDPEPEPVVQTKPEPAEVTPPPPEKVKPKAPDKPKPDTSLTKEVKKAQKLSYQDYLKKHPTPKQSAPAKTTLRSAKVPKVDATGIAAGVKGGSTANTRGGGGGKAMTREQQNQMDTYISLLIQELKKAHEPPPGVSDRLETKVTFDITASGAILNPRITKSSGDKAFDQSVLEAFLRMRSIGPTPNRRPDSWTVTFKMRDEA
ncbi:transport protein TonB [Lacunisphaera limnophila]|uniref:Transport protein TonB n=1 Tax=Lacunisphaera limnophila TaxID=1838286 RepID=A0A1D8AY59_9BACT|nr:TonB family protein [Lacunisphaera limnophila]AOS45826.1 transport protein TonB [Lacunisphaera limnophila]